MTSTKESMDLTNTITVEVLRKLNNSSVDCDEIARALPTLLSAFEREEDAEFLPEIVSLLLGQVVQALPVEDIEHAVLQTCLPSIKQYLLNALSSIHDILEFRINEDAIIAEITKILEICVQVLSDIENLLSYIISLNNVHVSNISSIPKTVVEIVNQVFLHCQKSKTDYKDIFTTVRNELMNLFQKCYKVQINMFTLLNEKLSFNCNFENESRLLVDVLDVLASTSEVVAELDTMSLVTHWKGYAQLTQTYAGDLCNVLDVSRSIKYLSVNINHQLCNFSVYSSTDKKLMMRSLKVSSLQLKVLIKLCEQYKGFLGDCHAELLNCLISLLAHTTQYLSQQGVAADVSAQVTTHLSAGAAPLLTHLLSDSAFGKEYLQLVSSMNFNSFMVKVGYCHLTNLILKKLIQLSSKDEEIQNLWIKSSLPVCSNVYKLIERGSETGELWVYEEDLYQSLLVHTAAFIGVTCSKQMFPELERLVMQWLLQPLLWPALFSSDLLCLIARLGTGELCSQLTCLLREVLSCWPAWDRQRPEWVYVSWTMGRLTPLLSEVDLHTLPSHLPLLYAVASDINTLLTEPCSAHSTTLYQSLMCRLTCLGEVLPLLPAEPVVADALYQLWQCAAVPEHSETCETSQWFLGFFSALVTATCSYLHLFNNSQIGHVLDALMSAVNFINTETLFQFAACEFLRGLATKTLDKNPNEAQVLCKISLLFVQLMQSKNTVAKQFALETFSFFAYITKYEEIVADTVANDSHLQTEITDYLEGVPSASSNISILSHIKALQQKFFHKCSHKVITEKENNDLNPCKKMKTSVSEEAISQALLRIDNDLCLIENFISSSVLSTAHQLCVDKIVMRLNKVKPL